MSARATSFWLLMLMLLLPLSALSALQPPLTAALRETCDANAPRVSLPVLQTDFRKWGGKCVRVAGILAGGILYADREALKDFSDPYRAGAPRSIVVRGDRRLPWPSRPMRVEITAQFRSCKLVHEDIERRTIARPDGIAGRDGEVTIILASGFCHYTATANYLQTEDVRILSRREVPRLTEAEVAPDRRWLIEASADLPGYADQVAAARDLIQAIVDGDMDRFLKRRFPDVDLTRVRRDERLADDLDTARTDFRRVASLRPLLAMLPRTGDDRMRVLISRAELADLAENDGGRPILLVCWCKTADCTGRWPVSSHDVDNRKDRPYLCVLTDDKEAEFSVYDRGFAEPRWSRPR